jgi:hypothetical protein
MAMAQQYFVAAWIPNQDKQQKFSTSVNNKGYDQQHSGSNAHKI